MLHYLGTGTRQYGLRPVQVYTRTWWEFQAVIAGRCAPILAGGRVLPLAGDRLWVFPPTTAHGWTGERGGPCEVVVFHFRFAPEPLRALAQRHGHHACALRPGDAALLRRLAGELRDEVVRPTSLGELRSQRALCELSLLALRDQPPAPLADPDAAAAATVAAALAWYGEHLAERPGLAAVARAAHVSTSHLRRLFQRVQRRSPLAALRAVRFRRAEELLADPARRLEAVAGQCGFASASAFCRAFTADRGCAPSAWRARQRRRQLNER